MPDDENDEVLRLIKAGDAIGALDAALRLANVVPNYDRHRSISLPCYICNTTEAPRDLVQIGTYSRRMGGNIQPGDRIMRPLCARCEELSRSG